MIYYTYSSFTLCVLELDTGADEAYSLVNNELAYMVSDKVIISTDKDNAVYLTMREKRKKVTDFVLAFYERVNNLVETTTAENKRSLEQFCGQDIRSFVSLLYDSAGVVPPRVKKIGDDWTFITTKWSRFCLGVLKDSV